MPSIKCKKHTGGSQKRIAGSERKISGSEQSSDPDPLTRNNHWTISHADNIMQQSYIIAMPPLLEFLITSFCLPLNQLYNFISKAQLPIKAPLLLQKRGTLYLAPLFIFILYLLIMLSFSLPTLSLHPTAAPYTVQFLHKIIFPA